MVFVSGVWVGVVQWMLLVVIIGSCICLVCLVRVLLWWVFCGFLWLMSLMVMLLWLNRLMRCCSGVVVLLSFSFCWMVFLWYLVRIVQCFLVWVVRFFRLYIGWFFFFLCSCVVVIVLERWWYFFMLCVRMSRCLFVGFGMLCCGVGRLRDSFVLNIVCSWIFMSLVILVKCVVLQKLLWLVRVRVFRLRCLVFVMSFLGEEVLFRNEYEEWVCSLVQGIVFFGWIMVGGVCLWWWFMGFGLVC